MNAATAQNAFLHQVLPDVSWIVLAWVTMEGVEATGRYVDRLRQIAETRATPLAKACTWRHGHRLNDQDLAKAKAYAAANGFQVFTYPRGETEPLQRARADVLQSQSKAER